VRRELHRSLVWSIVAGTALLLAAFASRAQGQTGSSSTAPTVTLPSGDATRGSALYLANGCWECHGYTGASGQGAPLAITGLSATAFVNYIRNPRTQGMPLYSATVVPDRMAADLYAYIKTFKKPADVKDIPLLMQILNEQ